MKLNLENCKFGIKACKFLGYLVSHKEIEANPKKIKAIMDMQLLKKYKGSVEAEWSNRSLGKIYELFGK